MNPDLPHMNLYEWTAVPVQLGRHGEALVDLGSLPEAYPGAPAPSRGGRSGSDGRPRL
ncbi:MAG: hypothetical protein MPI95_08375 [Nitrosopumilus sp.]|nr:hypothetical protein [Nitrosopumilus sp.]MDA7959076.1 hypothetical protein [Nitrosopumilus sp.]